MMAVWLDSSQGVNYYLQGHRSAPRKAPNSVFLLECGQMFPTCCSENLTRMFPEPNSKNLREEGGERDVGGRAMGGGRHVSVSVCRDLGKYVFQKRSSGHGNLNGSLCKRNRDQTGYPLSLGPLSQGPKW